MLSQNKRSKKTKFFFRNYRPCGTCYSLCEDTNSILCKLCTRFFHRKCAKLPQKSFQKLKSSTCSLYICSNECYNSVLPFYCSDDIDFFSAIFGEGLYPCTRCKRDCVEMMACIQCSVCEVRCHHVCSNLTNEEFNHKIIFFCSSQCKNVNVAFLPFFEFSDSNLYKEGIFQSPRTKTEKTKKNFGSKKSPLQNFIKLDHFLDLGCSYLNPNDLNDDHMSDGNSCITVFHNNLRSMKKNMNSITDIFQNCSSMPDVVAFSETKLNDLSDIPTMEGYHPFEGVHSPPAAGGVGAYISNKIIFFIFAMTSLLNETDARTSGLI